MFAVGGMSMSNIDNYCDYIRKKYLVNDRQFYKMKYLKSDALC
jgi:hypothetical protein